VPRDSSVSFTYDAFVSYRHTPRERAIADRLQAALHRFARPIWKLRAVRLYRDQTNLSARPDLWRTIEAALDAARHLILIASPESAQSPWVQRELEHWLATRGQANLVVVVTGGTLVWDQVAGCFDPVRSNALPAAVIDRFASEPHWLDLTWLQDDAASATVSDPRFLDVVATISATLQGRDKDDIAGDDVREFHLRRRLAAGAATLICIGFVTAMVFAVNFLEQRNLALAERSAAERQRAIAERQRDRALDQESRVLASMANAAIENSDAVTGLLLALRGLPVFGTSDDDKDSIIRPLNSSALIAARDAFWRQR
jgi:hypothetical protein